MLKASPVFAKGASFPSSDASTDQCRSICAWAPWNSLPAAASSETVTRHASTVSPASLSASLNRAGSCANARTGPSYTTAPAASSTRACKASASPCSSETSSAENRISREEVWATLTAKSRDSASPGSIPATANRSLAEGAPAYSSTEAAPSSAQAGLAEANSARQHAAHAATSAAAAAVPTVSIEMCRRVDFSPVPHHGAGTG